MAGTNQIYLVFEETQCEYTEEYNTILAAVCANESLVHEFLDEYNPDGLKTVWYEPQHVVQFKGDTAWENALVGSNS